jgi:hypothetical protein
MQTRRSEQYIPQQIPNIFRICGRVHQKGPEVQSNEGGNKEERTEDTAAPMRNDPIVKGASILEAPVASAANGPTV